MPRVAIGIPVFNEEKYVAKTLSSVLSQFEDCTDLEVLIQDNGSEDHSVQAIEKVLDSYSGLSSAIRFSKQSNNRGANYNHWKLYDETDSDYFLWVGGHDQISKRYVSSGLKTLEEFHDVSMFCGKHQAIRSDGQVLDKPVEYHFIQENPADRYLRSIASLTNCYIFHSMFRRSSLEGFNREKICPSGDHILISRWLWAGHLFQSRECSYIRRYFDSDDRDEKNQSGSYANRRNNVQFFDAYLTDLDNLASGLPSHVREILIRQASEILVKRFGVPHV